MTAPGMAPREVAAAARTLAADIWTAEAARAMRSAGIPVILLKGPVLAQWLYAAGEKRFYTDVDLLVFPRHIVPAEEVLTRLGYQRSRNKRDTPPGKVAHAQPWLRVSDRANVDLHHFLSGVTGDPELVSAELLKSSERMTVGGESVTVPGKPARALIVCLHAAQHELPEWHPAEDLRRAVDQVDEDTWREAAALAARLNALHGMAKGLRLTPAGDELADRLGLMSATLLQAADPAGGRTVLGFERLFNTRGAGPRARLLVREAFPTPGFMRWWLPWARRGPAALAAGYVYRLGWLARHAIPGWLSWRRARGTNPHP